MLPLAFAASPSALHARRARFPSTSPRRGGQRACVRMSRRARVDPRDEAFVTCLSCGADEITSAAALLRAGAARVTCGQCGATWTARAGDALTSTGSALVGARGADARSDGDEEPAQRVGVKLFVGGLGPKVGGDALRAAMEEFGEVTEARVVYDRVTGRSRGFGFVTMVGRAAASAAVDVLSGDSSTPLGRRLKIREAIE